MLILGIDPGIRSVGWSAVLEAQPLAGGTVYAKGRRNRSLLRTILTLMEFNVGRRIPDAIAVENGNSNPHTNIVLAAAKEFSALHKIDFLAVRPSSHTASNFHIPHFEWSSGHEQDAFRVARHLEMEIQRRQMESDARVLQSQKARDR